MKVSILAIGTELTSGQIVNRNCAWIAERCEALRIQVAQHLTVPDDWDAMLNGMKQSAAAANLVFITGGLGPTTDDFTREVVGEWVQKPMEFDSRSWDHIVARMTRLGRNVVESQKRQCFYPKGSEVLPNPEGTANGFYIQTKTHKIFVLPGPPRELAAIWVGAIQKILDQIKPPIVSERLARWGCIGKPEAELAELVEEKVRGSSVRTGYRLHAPYVEIKIWHHDTLEERIVLESVDEAIRPWTMTRDGQDLARTLVERLPDLPINIWDLATEGHLSERLTPLIRETPFVSFQIHTRYKNLMRDQDEFESFLRHQEHLTLALSYLQNDESWFAAISHPELIIRRLPQIDMRSHFTERGRLTAVEYALKEWLDFFSYA